jgi:hypothetical protein
MERDNEFLLQFTPELKCFDCGTLTSTGIASHDQGYTRLEPLCARHGFMGLVPHPSAEEIREHLYTVKRFVLSQKDGQGEVVSVEPVSFDELEAHGIEVKGDTQERFFEDDVWRVVYQRDGAQATYYVLWSYEDTAFDDLYQS